VKTLGGSLARSAFASISIDVKGTRSFRRIITTSEAVHAMAARRTPCMGLGPLRDAASPPSKRISCPPSAFARKRIASRWTSWAFMTFAGRTHVDALDELRPEPAKLLFAPPIGWPCDRA